MSIEQRHYTTKDGDPVLELKIKGFDDVYRFSNHLLSGQVEFGEVGRRTHRYLKRTYGAVMWRRMMRRFHGDGGYTEPRLRR